MDDFFSYNRPHYVFHLASLVFGLLGNMENQLNAIATNTLINQQLFLACQRYPVRKIFFASTVAGYGYPYQSLPLTEPYFFSGAPHAGEYGYGMAKRHALGYLEILRREYDIDYCYGIFTNLFDPYDRFDIHCGHVIPSLIEKAAASVQRQDRCLHVWGRPETSRDFMFSEEAGAAALHAFLHGSGMGQHCQRLRINPGAGGGGDKPLLSASPEYRLGRRSADRRRQTQRRYQPATRPRLSPHVQP
ncbi:MAG: NAD-dependent epimerase/dehydratase family protein [Sodalis sp. (in: enterobacteria)]|uniref:NAD-dependent epimerase/dehydratase family protein n=1 Tax=Sodalis sp. (in: enterobacteria) TaxID=1898979 RepID=UPI0039E61523